MFQPLIDKSCMGRFILIFFHLPIRSGGLETKTTCLLIKWVAPNRKPLFVQ